MSAAEKIYAEALALPDDERMAMAMRLVRSVTGKPVVSFAEILDREQTAREASGAPSMTDDEINEEIRLAREEMRRG